MELVHLGIKLDYHSVGIIVVAGYIVAGRVPRRAPELIDSGLNEGYPPPPQPHSWWGARTTASVLCVLPFDRAADRRLLVSRRHHRWPQSHAWPRQALGAPPREAELCGLRRAGRDT